VGVHPLAIFVLLFFFPSFLFEMQMAKEKNPPKPICEEKSSPVYPKIRSYFSSGASPCLSVVLNMIYLDDFK